MRYCNTFAFQMRAFCNNNNKKKQQKIICKYSKTIQWNKISNKEIISV